VLKGALCFFFGLDHLQRDPGKRGQFGYHARMTTIKVIGIVTDNSQSANRIGILDAQWDQHPPAL
jgi:hypothetical protein